MRKSPDKFTINCWRCKKETEVGPNGRYCEPCKKIVKAETQATQTKKQCAAKKIERQLARQVPVKKVSVTDSEQREIDRREADKFNLNLQTKFYQPGTAEFDALVAKVTPLKNIRKGVLGEGFGIFAEPQDRLMFGRRHEGAGI